MKRSNKLEIVLILLIFITLFIIVIHTPIIYKYRNDGKLIINEVMSSNKSTIMDSYGDYSDYIEIYNGYNEDINLHNYYLSDDSLNLRKWSFPDITIKANSYLLVFATGKDTVNEGEVHTNFKISNKGEVLTLADKNAKPLSRIYFNETKSDTSYGYNGNEYVYYYVATPEKENNGKYSNDAIKIKESNINLKITEYSKGNNGKIELFNESDKDINLEGFYLSNDLNKPYMYIFPNVIIKANDYLVINASGKDTFNEKEIHTNFQLNYEDRNLILSDNEKNTIEKIYLQEIGNNMSCGYYDKAWHIYKESTFGSSNKDNYLDTEDKISKDIRINEVSNTQIELKNLTKEDINLDNYAIGDKSGVVTNLKNIIKANDYIVFNSDSLGFGINYSTEIIYLYKNGKIIDEYQVGRLIDGVSSGINEDNKRVFYKNITMGRSNSSSFYQGYVLDPVFDKDGGYTEKGTKVSITTNDDSTIYYTLDGSFPSTNSTKYTSPITIDKTTVIKVVAYKDNYLPSDIISRTFIVGKKHDIPIVSISTDYNNLFGYNGIISNFHQNSTRKISLEFYENDGLLGTSFVGDTKLSGMDSRLQPQKSMSVYLRKEYGKKEVTYPFFNNYENNTYGSILFRNAGEDPKSIRIMDAVLQRTLKDKMDIDMQDYRPVVMYINGEYFGIYNMRDKLNSDYIVTKFGTDKDDIDLIKYSTPVRGSDAEYNKLVNYINNNDPANSKNYEYIKSQIDVQELCNYWITQSYYGNTDLGNIRYWKSKDGKWRFMIYDLDWSMWNSNLSMNYPVMNTNIPAVTYLYSSISITRRLYRNSEFRDLYLKTLAYHLKNTFNPDRMNGIVDELAKEIETEMPNHIDRWGREYPYLSNMNRWHSNLDNFKKMITNRYNYVTSHVRSEFNLSEAEYNKYFKELQ